MCLLSCQGFLGPLVHLRLRAPIEKGRNKPGRKKKKPCLQFGTIFGWGQELCGKSPGFQGAKDKAGQELFALICCL